MRKILLLSVLMLLSVYSYAQREPENNLGKSLSIMKQKFPELRYIKTDQKGEQYEDGYPQDGIATFFYFRNNRVVEECMICQTNDGFPLDWFRSLCKEFNKNWYSNLRSNNNSHKKYIFSNFSVDIIYVSEGSNNTTLIVYSTKRNNSQLEEVQATRPQPSTPISRNPISSNRPISKDPTSTKNLEWYEIGYTENKGDVYGMQAVGSFSAKSNPTVFGSKTYSDAFHSALKKLQKKAAKKGARVLLITYKSSMNTDFLTVRVEAIGYK